ncbi:hypothetical protein GY45DRAFT_435647 [Cubamyces sp. BRFM 1775]|nr:hypothetical protein GY45DRAFT_435647 [Cubamyces sp. BRFM 1775]
MEGAGDERASGRPRFCIMYVLEATKIAFLQPAASRFQGPRVAFELLRARWRRVERKHPIANGRKTDARGPGSSRTLVAGPSPVLQAASPAVLTSPCISVASQASSVQGGACALAALLGSTLVFRVRVSRLLMDIESWTVGRAWTCHRLAKPGYVWDD